MYISIVVFRERSFREHLPFGFLLLLNLRPGFSGHFLWTVPIENGLIVGFYLVDLLITTQKGGNSVYLKILGPLWGCKIFNIYRLFEDHVIFFIYVEFLLQPNVDESEWIRGERSPFPNTVRY